jgi:hypothetical protein
MSELAMIGKIFFGVWTVMWLAEALLLGDGRKALDKKRPGD